MPLGVRNGWLMKSFNSNGQIDISVGPLWFNYTFNHTCVNSSFKIPLSLLQYKTLWQLPMEVQDFFLLENGSLSEFLQFWPFFSKCSLLNQISNSKDWRLYWASKGLLFGAWYARALTHVIIKSYNVEHFDCVIMQSSSNWAILSPFYHQSQLKGCAGSGPQLYGIVWCGVAPYPGYGHLID